MEEIMETLEEADSRLERNRQLESLGRIVAEIRDEAVNARKRSGIERQWKEDEEYYEGIDQYNHPVLRDDYLKPRSVDGVVTERKSSSEDGSTAFINITGPFVDYASARLGDILLPANEWNFKIAPTPIPELDQLENDDSSMIVNQNGQPLGTVGDEIKKRKREINRRVEKAEKRIHDWLVECGYKKQSRKQLENCAKVGTGIMKGPVPERKIKKAFVNGELQISHIIKPVSKCIEHWDCFPDMSCGEDIQEGAYFIERDHLTARQLSNLVGVDGYLEDQIARVLREGPGKKYQNTTQMTPEGERFEVWYCYTDLKPEHLAILDEEFAEYCLCQESLPPTVSAVVVLVNDVPIKGYLNTYESGEYPYDFAVWRRNTRIPFGTGVARMGRKAQDLLNASVRALLDNMGLSAIPMIALIKKALTPADKSWKIKKGKLWFLNENTGIMDINHAIQTLVIPSMQAELSANIELALKFMEDITGITFLLQGQQGSAPDTVGGMNLLHQNASTVLRRSGRNYDEGHTEPHIKRYHEYLLIDPNVPDDEKGDLDIKATGASYLIEREIQAMQLPQVLQMISENPKLEKSPKKAGDEILRAYKFDPAKFDMDEDEKQQLAEQMQGQVAPQVQAAQIRAETDLQKEQIRQEANVQKIQVDMDRDRVFAEGVTERNRMAYEKNITDTQLRIQEMELKLQLAQLDYANKNNMTLAQIKADLARDTMKLNLQKELALRDDVKAAEQVITPPSEPAGRAEDGKAFQE